MAERTSGGLPPAERVRFPTRVDGWLLAILLGALFGGVLSAIAAIQAGQGAGWIALGVLAGSTLLVLAFAVPTRYELANDGLLVRFGLFHLLIPYESIERVRSTRNPLSAPAWSLDRLAVEHRTGANRRTTLISPSRPGEFLELLAARSGLVFTEGELRRDRRSAGDEAAATLPNRPA